ncbi:hypothetical protein C5167_026667 [Papaver somniferum]|uniref:adult-specific cuticular protein ACP-22-like n=1 Tax=Papaver somniferum TaxID=3469 RepID=UPI000E7056BE|nr:adult-specific cuticular protein ACP-22-like [Papaver somniferum]RZC85996.1 hypothetical protein C5167_026667 [Papaver somniferum]
MMSIAFEGGCGSSFIHHGGGGMSCISILGNGGAAGFGGGVKDQMNVLKRGEEEVVGFGGGGGGGDSGSGSGGGDSCSSSSSIGKNSDLSNGGGGGGSDDDDGEVQSSYKGGPFDSMVDSLEDVLPIRKGISKFYCGKSKSFTSLRDATSSSSIKEIAKPENVYSKKRKNLLACSIILGDKSKNFPLRSNGGGISKRSITTSRSSLALAVAMNKTNSNESNCTSENSSSPPPLPRYRPPLHPNAKQAFNKDDIESPLNSSPSSPQKGFSNTSWRSFSLADLQYAAANSATASNPRSIGIVDKQKKFH